PDKGTTWVRTTAAGSSGSASFMIKNFNGNPVGQTDDYVTPSFNLTYLSQPTLTFKVANAQRNPSSADHLRVYISDDCGTTWIMNLFCWTGCRRRPVCEKIYCRLSQPFSLEKIQAIPLPN